MNTRQPRPHELDPELIALFADDPEGLAIVDAIAATQRPGRARRRTVVLVAAAALIAAAVLGALLVTNSRAGVIERAFRVVAQPAVVHLALVDNRPAVRIIDLQNGRSRVLHHRLDEWYQHSRSERRLRDSVGSVIVSDRRAPVRAVDSLATSFIETYRRALVDHTARVSREGRVDGLGVYWLTFTARGSLVRVAVDQQNLKPIALTIGTRGFRVVAFNGLERIPASTHLPVRPPNVRVPSASAVNVALRPLSLPTLRAVVTGATPASGGLELRYSTKPTSGRLQGQYVRLVFHSGSTARSLPPFERDLAGDSIALLDEKSTRVTEAFARVGDYLLAIETNLGPGLAVRVAEALEPR